MWLIFRQLPTKAGWWDAPLTLQDLAETISTASLTTAYFFNTLGKCIVIIQKNLLLNLLLKLSFDDESLTKHGHESEKALVE